MNVAVVERETGVPPSPAFRVIASQIGMIFHVRAEAGWADQGAVCAIQTARGDLVPTFMVEAAGQQISGSRRIHFSFLRAGRGFHDGLGMRLVFGTALQEHPSLAELLQ